MNWEVGDKARCVNIATLTGLTPPALKLNAVYIVNAIHECSCGMVSLDVGLFADPMKNYICWNCRGFGDHGGHRWCSAQRFVKELSIEDEAM